MVILAGSITSICGIFYSVHAFRKVGLVITPVALLSVFLLNSVLTSQNLIYSDFAKIWSNYGAYYNAKQNVAYFMGILFVYLVPYVLLRRHLYQSASDLRGFLKNLRGLAFTLGAIGLAAFAAIHILILDLGAVLRSDEYLFLASHRALRIVNPATVFIQSSYKFAGLLAYLLFAIAIAARKPLIIAILVFPICWFGAYELAGHSRFSVVYFGAVASILLFVRRPILGVVFVLLAAMALVNALQGRTSGTHGLSQVGEAFSYLMSFQDVSFVKFYTNIFEGVFSQGEAFYYRQHEYNNHYKLLSFSPFPSFVDGFRSHALPHAVRLNYYVPMGATGEVYLFGPYYMAVYWCTMAFAYICTIRMAIERRYNSFLFSIAILSLCTFLQFTYPVRWVFRFLILLILVYYGGRFLMHRRGGGQSRSRIAQA